MRYEIWDIEDDDDDGDNEDDHWCNITNYDILWDELVDNDDDEDDDCYDLSHVTTSVVQAQKYTDTVKVNPFLWWYTKRVQTVTRQNWYIFNQRYSDVIPEEKIIRTLEIKREAEAIVQLFKVFVLYQKKWYFFFINRRRWQLWWEGWPLFKVFVSIKRTRNKDGEEKKEQSTNQTS